MRIAELFRSLQGEGRLTGVESVFVRVAGCNLRCGYCDTPYASWKPDGEELSVTEILDRVEDLWRSPRPVFLEELIAVQGPQSPNLQINKSTNPHVVLTGGEPMLFAELVPLAAGLCDRGWHITIETAGTLYLPVACDLMSISPKLSNSTPNSAAQSHWIEHHVQHRHAPEVVRRLIAEYECQLKFVIDNPADCEEFLTYLAEFPEIERAAVMLMPQGIDAETLAQKAFWLEPFCAAHGFTFCPRRHVEWFGAERAR